jgi:hypothetical protein
MGSRPESGPAYPLLKKNESNPKNKFGPRQSCHHEKHCKNFQHCVEIHLKPVRDQPFYDSFKTLAALSKLPVGR